MRLILCSFLFLFGLTVAGCGGSNSTTTVDASAVEQYVEDNADAVALQAKLDAEAELDAEDDDE